MTVQPTNEFNIAALFSESGRRNLLNLALSGNDSVVTPFAMRDGVNARTEAQRRRDEEFQTFARVMLASQEQTARFMTRLDRLAEANDKALEEIRKDIRRVDAEIEQMRRQAPVVTLPDGSRRIVFRDFDKVRDESGALVSEDIVKAENVSKDLRDWAKFKDKLDYKKDLKAEETQELAQKAEIERAQGLGLNGTAEEQEALVARLEERAPARSRRFYDADNEKRDKDRNVPERKTSAASAYTQDGLQSAVKPTPAFAGAAKRTIAGATAPDLDDDIKPQGPPASAPAPM